MFARISFLLALFLLSTNFAFSQFRVNDIFIERLNVFDSTSKDWFFAAKLANSLHFLTRQYVIEDELLFSRGDIIDDNILLETEKNLRSMNLFSRVEITIDSLDPLNCNVYVVTKDRWSTNPSLLFWYWWRSLSSWLPNRRVEFSWHWDNNCTRISLP